MAGSKACCKLSLKRAEQNAQFENFFSAELLLYPRLSVIPERGANVANTLAFLCEICRGHAMICALFEHNQIHLLHHANIAADRRAIKFKEVAEFRQGNLALLLQYLQEGELRDVNPRRGERIIQPAGRRSLAGKRTIDHQ
jgi:hypothetical protein